MPLDIKVLRKDPEKVKDSQRRRFKDIKIVDDVLQIDNLWKTTMKELDNYNKKKNLITKQIKEIYKKRKNGNTEGMYQAISIGIALCILSILYTRFDLLDNWLTILITILVTLLAIDRGYHILNYCDKVNRLKREKIDLEQYQKTWKQRAKNVQRRRDCLLNMIGNIVDDAVPTSNDEEKDNELITTWNVKSIKQQSNINGNYKLKQHDELLWMIGGYERKHGAQVAGNKGYYLIGPGALLNIALQNYGIQFLVKRKFIPIYPPFFMNKDMMSKTVQLEDYDETLYHVTGESNDKEKYLIATSEQPISALHFKERLHPKDLPIRYGGISTCFRKEAGAGNDFCGIFRVHQFEKIEQFIYCKPNESWNLFDELIKNAEEFYQSLGIGYRIINIVSGHLNNAAAKKYDLEGWFPGTGINGRYRELVSCSNCTDYQAIAMETRYDIGGKDKQYVHMLNATLVATTRTICAILENYQTEKGIIVPKVLRSYMNGMEFIPFINPPFTKCKK